MYCKILVLLALIYLVLSDTVKSKLKLVSSLLTYASNNQSFKCDVNDAECIFGLGVLYFKGTNGVLSLGQDTTKKYKIAQSDHALKNFTKALLLWKNAADLGSSESQYHMSIVYASYFNPPRFLTQSLAFQAMNSTGMYYTFYNRSTAITPEEFLKGSLDVVELSKFYLTMRILDLSSITEYPLVLEASLLKSWKQTIKIKVFGNKEKKFVDDTVASTSLGQVALNRYDSLALVYLFAAAQSNHIGALMTLGFRHFHGIGVPQRCITAASYYMQVAREASNFSSKGIPPAAEAIRLSILGLQNGIKNQKTLSFLMQMHYSKLQLHVAESGDPDMQILVGKKFIFGVDGFPQDFSKAVHYFRLAARQNRKESVAFLGYLSALGLGLQKDLDVAFQLFSNAARSPDDVLGHNGLGFVYFYGTEKVKANPELAAYYFNVSASKGFPDAQFNLAALYITGVGVAQSFSKALVLLSSALEQGHSAAGYLLGLLHLDGFGTIRDCNLATVLFKAVAEKHTAVTNQLKSAFQFYQTGKYNEAAFAYWKLAEMGIVGAQANLAYLLDGGSPRRVATKSRIHSAFIQVLRGLFANTPFLRSTIFTPATLFSLDNDLNVGVNKAFAQRYWELASIQGSTEAFIRLGDYAYYGWGTTTTTNTVFSESLSSVTNEETFAKENNGSFSSFRDALGQSMNRWAVPKEQPIFHVIRRNPDYKVAYSFYERAITGTPMNEVVLYHQARAEFNLARMHEFGYGVKQDFRLARRRLLRVSQTGIFPLFLTKISLLLLEIHAAAIYVLQQPFRKVANENIRLLFLVVSTVLLIIVFCLRCIFSVVSFLMISER